MNVDKVNRNRALLPSGWRWVRLGDVCIVSTGGTPPRSQEDLFKGVIPWIKPEDLDRDLYLLQSKEYLSKEGATIVGILPRGTVLVSCIGKIGKAAIAGVPLTTNQQINSLMPKDMVEPLFLFFCVKEHAGKTAGGCFFCANLYPK